MVPLTLVSASAGYGKSVLVSHWADSLKHPCAWISLDESDSELPQFIDYLAKALDGQLPGAFPATAGLRGAGQLPPVPALAARLINELDRLDAPLVLVLDDYQRIEPISPVHMLLSHVLEHPPRNLHLVLIGRRDPPLALWALRAASMLNEVRSRDLCFRDEEVDELLAATVSTAIGSEAIAHLQRDVEGWAVGLRLASLLSRTSAQEANASLPTSLVTPAVLESKIAEIEATSGLAEEAKARLIEQYRKALRDLESARANQESAAA